MTVILDGTEFMSAAAAARQLLTTEMKILMLLRHNELSGELVEGSWLVTRESVEAYRPREAHRENRSDCRTSCNSSHCGCH
jgi:hypothetical protein